LPLTDITAVITDAAATDATVTELARAGTAIIQA
jgi:hypothetical protein